MTDSIHRCEACLGTNAYVSDSRNVPNHEARTKWHLHPAAYRWRRYKCADCDHRWTTIELRPEDINKEA
jgi:transcriptional regulator NrdR family protein